ncbi:putative non-LTR retroelement reverse transcriptase [Senna tora]|uniref:Putative non-LTR retroelement reverse transcriptase n=1 Tax=Senna tora TaxID=362788 RepID=A0A834W4Y9_9FABA|nr:putative non-LTR retroelement reverse transcriptase [Senna tora]
MLMAPAIMRLMMFRNANGKWILGLASKFGKWNSFLAELWGTCWGLGIVWIYNFRQRDIDVDSLLAVNFVKNGVDKFHPYAPIISEIRNMLARNWDICLSHCYRESNRTADSLANLSHGLDFGVHGCP